MTMTTDSLSPRSTTISSTIAVLAAAALFGTTGTALALGPDDTGALSAGTLRLIIGGLGLVLVAAFSGSPLRQWPSHMVSARTPLVVGAVFVALYQLGFFYATTTAGVALATVVTIGTSPLAARAIGALRGRPAPGSWWSRAAAILLAGLIVLVIGSGGETTFSPLGVLAAAIAGFSYAVYTECGAMSLDAGVDSTATMAVMFLGAGIIAGPLLVVEGVSWLGEGSGIVMILYLSLVTLTVAYVWFGWGLRHLPPTTVVMLTMFEPVVAALLAITVLDERLSFLSWVGIVLVVGGLTVVGRRSHEAATVDT